MGFQKKTVDDKAVEENRPYNWHRRRFIPNANGCENYKEDLKKRDAQQQHEQADNTDQN